MHSDCRRRIIDMLSGWEQYCDEVARARSEHADKYYAESDSINALRERATDVITYGDQQAVELFLLERVLPFILEGK